MAGKTGSAVVLAIIGNGILTLIKFGAFLLSRSPAMLSEAIHSFADTANQTLLFIGIRRSQRPADARYHWGYGNERFLFALLSAMGIFVLGCGVTVYHGVAALLSPPEVSSSWLSYAVLGIAILVDGSVMLAAVREINRQKGDKSFLQFLRESSDPTVLAVLFEDAIATLGCVIALVGIWLAEITGNPVFDAVSSIIIGILLGVVAIWLGWRNSVLIIGPAIPEDVEAGVLKYLNEQKSIESIRGVRTRIVGSERFAFSADVDYDGKFLGRRLAPWVAERTNQLADQLAKNQADEQPDDQAREQAIGQFAAEFGERMLDELAAEIDRIEADLIAEYPILSHVDLESDDAKKPS